MQQKQTNSHQAKKQSSSDTSWFALMSFLGVVILLLILYFTGIFQLVSEQVSVKDNDKLTTYYQWTTASGQIVISKSKPSSKVNFITFEGSSDLLNNQNMVDEKLIQKGQLARQEIFKRKDEQTLEPNNIDLVQLEKITQSSDSLVAVLMNMSDLSNRESFGELSAHMETLMPAELVNMSDEDKCKWLEVTIEHLDDRLRQRNKAAEAEKLKSNLSKVRKEWFKQCR